MHTLEVMGSCEMRMSVQGGGEVDAAQLLVVKGDHAALLERQPKSSECSG